MKQVIGEPLLSHWYRALSSPFGVELVCSDFEATRLRMYGVRREAKDLELEGLSLCRSPFDPSKLWIVKKAQKNEET